MRYAWASCAAPRRSATYSSVSWLGPRATFGIAALQEREERVRHERAQRLPPALRLRPCAPCRARSTYRRACRSDSRCCRASSCVAAITLRPAARSCAAAFVRRAASLAPPRCPATVTHHYYHICHPCPRAMRRRRYVSCTSNPKVSFVFVPSPCPTGCVTGSLRPRALPSRRRGLRARGARLVSPTRAARRVGRRPLRLGDGD
jgi:hypothetical protein